MVDREPTTGELAVKLDLVLSNLAVVTENMVTKDVFETWRQGNNDRIQRSEDTLREWIKTSTEAHVALDKDSRARHQESAAELAKANDAIRAKIDKEITVQNTRWENLEKERKSEEKDLKAARRSSINIWIVAALAVAGNIIVFFATKLSGL
jgi:phage-related minor tail protein